MMPMLLILRYINTCFAIGVLALLLSISMCYANLSHDDNFSTLSFSTSSFNLKNNVDPFNLKKKMMMDYSNMIQYSNIDQDPFSIDIHNRHDTASTTTTLNDLITSSIDPYSVSTDELMRQKLKTFQPSQTFYPSLQLALSNLNDNVDVSNRNLAERTGQQHLQQQQKQNMKQNQHRFTSTGTTIAGVCGKNFVVIGADSRSTSNTIVADKRCYKLHTLASNVVAAGAGTAADLDHICLQCYYTLLLLYRTSYQNGNDDILDDNLISGTGTTIVPSKHTKKKSSDTINSNLYKSYTSSYYLNRPVSVQQVCRYLQDKLYEQDGTCQANLIVGGVYNGIASLRAIHPHGSSDDVKYTALGSGGLAALAILEQFFHHRLIQVRQQQNNKSSKDISTSTAKNNNSRKTVKADNKNNNNNNIYNDNLLTVAEAVELIVTAISSGIQNDLGSGSQVDIVVITPNGISKFKRSAVPEEQLQPIRSPATNSHTPTTDTTTDTPTTAAKSFMDSTSNHNNNNNQHLYTIQSTRVLQESYLKQHRTLHSKWKDILFDK